MPLYNTNHDLHDSTVNKNGGDDNVGLTEIFQSLRLNLIISLEEQLDIAGRILVERWRLIFHTK